jgi:hypothetical protein
MTTAEPQPTTFDCIFENILGFMLPFFLTSTEADTEIACLAIRELAEGFNVATANELELVGRILGFSTVAMDNLRLSMNPELSDTKVLRYRSNAVALSRAGEQCRKILTVMQANRNRPAQPAAPTILAPTLPAPVIAEAAPPAPKSQPTPAAAPPQSATDRRPAVAQPLAATVSLLPQDMETMRLQARAMLAAYIAKPSNPATMIPEIADPATLVSAAVRQALNAARPTTPG